MEGHLDDCCRRCGCRKRTAGAFAETIALVVAFGFTGAVDIFSL